MRISALQRVGQLNRRKFRAVAQGNRTQEKNAASFQSSDGTWGNLIGNNKRLLNRPAPQSGSANSWTTALRDDILAAARWFSTEPLRVSCTNFKYEQ